MIPLNLSKIQLLSGRIILVDDLSKTYYFGIAVWENDRLYRHTKVKKPFALTFK